MKIVIIGGVAGGATAATRLRRLNETDEIVLLEKGEYISFANCGLPYHVGGTIKERENLLLQTVDGMSAQYGIDIRNFSEVTEINPTEKWVAIRNHQSGETYQESFDKLIISTGAKPIVPPIEGLDQADNVFTLRNIPDMDLIKAYIQNHQVQTATVIGGGFIGLEMMENLVELGLNVNLVEMAPQVMANLDFEMAQPLHAQINLHQVNLVLEDGLKSIQENGKKLVLNSGKELATDMILLSIGVLPENTLAKAANFELGFKGAIKVNERFETSYPDIYAIGDVIEVTDGVTGHATNIPLAGPANRQGRLVADVINGLDVAYEGVIGTSVAKIFELTAASTGQNEKSLKRAEIPYEVIHIHPNSHASYYPGAAPIAMKLIFSPEGKILGAQAVGTEGVEKRIDVIATAIKLGATAEQLAALELSYAPPYSSAKDPVNMLGYTVDNVMGGRVKTIQWHEVDDLLAEGAYFLDVREEFELAIGQFANTKHIPLNQLRGRLAELPTDQTIYVYCQVGQRGYNAARILQNAGLKVKNLDGGYKTYKNAKYQLREITFKPTEKTTPMAGMSKPAIKPLEMDAVKVDASGLACPGPILKVKENMDQMADGQVMTVEATDSGFTADIENWAKNTGHTIIENKVEGNRVVATIQKGQAAVLSEKRNEINVTSKNPISEIPAQANINSTSAEPILVDACGLQCPGPLLKVKENMDKMVDGQVMKIEATDFGFSADIDAWAKTTGHTILENKIEGNRVVATVQKGRGGQLTASSINQMNLPPEGVLTETNNGATMVVFSGDLDKAIASMIIASGAAAYGKKVTLFFTFWGLSILKKQKVKKSGIAKMFDMMLPSGADSLPLSNMNMGGAGRTMIKQLMKQKNVDSLPKMIEQAHQLGVKFVACTMSMDLMGIEKEELFDFVEYGGVATFIGDSQNANMQLFI